MGSIVSPWTVSAQRTIHGTCSLVILFRAGSVLELLVVVPVRARGQAGEAPAEGEWLARRHEPLRVREGGLQPIPGRLNSPKWSRFGRSFFGNIFE